MVRRMLAERPRRAEAAPGTLANRPASGPITSMRMRPTSLAIVCGLSRRLDSRSRCCSCAAAAASICARSAAATSARPTCCARRRRRRSALAHGASTSAKGAVAVLAGAAALAPATAPPSPPAWRRRRPRLPGLAALSRRQGRGDGARRVRRAGAGRRARRRSRSSCSPCGSTRLRLAGLAGRDAGAGRCGGLAGQPIVAVTRRRLAASPHSIIADAIADNIDAAARRHRTAAARSAAADGHDWTQTIAVLGAGSWGTALAVHLARVGHDVRLWGRDAALVADDARAARERRSICPDVRSPTARARDHVDCRSAVAGAQLIVVAVPSHGLRATCCAAARRTSTPAPCRRQRDQGARARHAAAHVRGDRRGSRAASRRSAVLSGPSFAPSRARAADRGRRWRRATAGAAELVQARVPRPAVSGSTAPTTWSASRSAAR